MRLGLRELRRKPGRFGAALAALTLLTLLLLILGGLLDGLYLGSTGLLRSQPGELVTFSSDARESVLRSRVSAEELALIRSTSGVQEASGFGVALVGIEVPGEADLASAAVIGYQQASATVPAPPDADGEAYADTSLRSSGVELGQTVLAGPQKVPLTVIGWVEDTDFLLQGGLWTNAATWRNVLGTVRPDSVLPDGTFQAVTVTVTPGTDPQAVAGNISHISTDTTTVTRDAAVQALPGIQEQNSTFTAIIGVTLLVAGLVVALFFALLTLERTPMYGVFKAIGASSRQIFVSVVTQAVVVALVSFAIGGLLVFLLSRPIPAEVPIQLVPSRVVFTGVGLLVMAVIGSAITLRRVIRIDPASAIG